MAAIGVSTALLCLMEMIFVACSPAIIAAGPTTPARLVVPWTRPYIAQHDGIETYIVLPGMFLFLAASAAATFAMRRISRNVALACGLAGACAAAVIALPTRSSEFFPLSDGGSRLVLGGVTSLCVWGWYEAYTRTSRSVRIICLVATFLLFAAVVVLSLLPASLVDYGYFIGPGLKLLQGERLGSFYMQYSLIETLLFTAMIVMGLKVHVMAVVLSLLFAGWYVLYWLVARRLFEHRFIALLCMAALVVTRFFAIRDHPAYLPQVLPLRLDLWVPLVLAVRAWGLASWRTSLAFGIVYAFDSTFGFLFSAVYAGALLLSWWSSSDRKASLRSTLLLLLPTVVAACFQKLVFGSVVSPAATHYLGVQIGFMPISDTSLFWPITMLVGWAAAVFAWRHTERSGRIGLLLCALATVQFTYFFGRSHDHNLINISGIWLLVIFLGIDQAAVSARARIVMGTALIVALTVMSTQQFLPKFERAGARLRSGVWVEPNPNELALTAIGTSMPANTVMADPADAYLNYRLHLAQRGFYAPFEANIFIDETAAWMDDQIRLGMHIRTTDDRWSTWIADFNGTPIMQQRRRRFDVIPDASFPGFGLLEIVEQQAAAESGYTEEESAVAHAHQVPGR